MFLIVVNAISEYELVTAPSLTRVYRALVLFSVNIANCVFFFPIIFL